MTLSMIGNLSVVVIVIGLLGMKYLALFLASGQCLGMLIKVLFVEEKSELKIAILTLAILNGLSAYWIYLQ